MVPLARKTKKVIPVILVICLLVLVVWSLSQNWMEILDNTKENLIEVVEAEYGHSIEFSEIKITALNRLEIKELKLETDFYKFSTARIEISYQLRDFLLQRNRVVESIDTIEFFKPELEWLDVEIEEEIVVPDFLNQFRGSILLNEGNFKANSLTELDALESIKGEVDFLAGDELEFNLEGEIKNIEVSPFSVVGRTNLTDFDVELAFEQLDLKTLPTKLKQKLEQSSWQVKKGLLNGKLVLNGELAELAELNYRADLEIKELLAANSDFEEEVSIVGGSLRVEQRQLSLQDLVAEFNGSQIQIAGLINDWQSSPELYLRYAGSQLDLTNFKDYLPQQLELSGSGDIAGQLRGSIEAPTINTEVRLTEGQLNETDFENISFRLWYRDGIANLSDFNAHLASGNLAGRGTVKWQPGEDLVYSMSVDASTVELSELELMSELPVELAQDLSGSLNGSLVVSGQHSWENLNLFGNIEVTSGAVNDYDFDSLVGTFWLEGDKLLLSNLVLESGPSRWKATGLIDETENLSLDIEAEQIDLADLKGVHNYESLVGIADLQGEVKGRVTEPNFIGEININNLGYLDREFEELTGRVSYKKGQLDLSDFVLAYGETDYQLTGSIELIEEPLIDLSLQTERGKINDLSKLFVEQDLVDFEGEFSGEVAIKGAVNDLIAAGNLQLLSGQVNSIDLTGGVIDFAWQDDNLRVNQLRLANQEVDLTAQGSVDIEGNLDLKLTGQNFALTHLSNFDSRFEGFTGNLNFEGLVAGTVFAPEFAGELELQEAEVRGYNFDKISGGVKYLQDKVDLKSLKIVKDQTIYGLDGGLNLAKEEFVGLELKMDNGKLDELVALLPLEVEGLNLRTPHSFFGEVVIENEFLTPRISGELLVKDVDQIGSINLQGSYDYDSGADLSLIAKSFTLAPFNELIPIEQELGGRVNLAADIKGDLAKLDIDSEIEVWGGRVGNLRYDSLTGAIALNEGKDLKITQRLEMLVDENNLITTEGYVPLDSKEKPLYFNLNLGEGDLALLANLVNGIEQAQGSSSGRLIIYGNRNDPNFRGDLQISEGKIWADALPAELSAINAQLSIEEQLISVDQFSGSYGSGKFESTGQIAIDEWGLGDLELQLSGKEIPFEHGSWQGKNNVDLEITGTALQPHIGGEIVAYDTRILIPFEWPVAEDPIIGPSYDLIIRPGDNVRVYNDNIDILVEQGAVNLITIDQELAMRGNLRSKIGRFNYYNNRFEVDSARATFNVYDGFMPYLDIDATTELTNVTSGTDSLPGRDVDVESVAENEVEPEVEPQQEFEEIEVKLNMSGPADQMNISFESEPQMDEELIVNLLARQGGLGSFLEGNYEEALEAELWRIVQAGLTMRLFSGIEETIEEKWGLDQFRIYPSFGRDWRIRMGKYLSEEFFLKYEQTINGEDRRSIGFEYEIMDRLRNLILDGSINNEEQYQLKLQMILPFN
ncbi:translocation/assembly module TamB domain-containing protein [Fuchsiella alkaliacetigena]|uniref:translocation/assembly module TamB domain-containing protein n=1 Tax=Fuchsiella alkaliacetigena TaxID=957042 RepID=UPI00200B3940|nr:translocation/assembly module TamB domain-containing protein [Fuchsiella alkaliacetigena]MCK8824567.1 translocation/assembly module TamB domain-containing protein [Fuchsiella alkaliacetigena]